MQIETHEALVRSLCNHGRADHYAHAHVGWNSRMGGVQAAFLTRVLAILPELLEHRRRAAAWYRERLASAKRVRVYGPPESVVENGYLNVLTTNRDGRALADALKAKGIGSARTYPSPMDAQPPVRDAGAILHGTLDHSRRFCDAVVNLPLFYGIREDEQEEAVRGLLSCLEG
jgi:dTDP-4-amino-4,6-dideoxygalactose transaminase